MYNSLFAYTRQFEKASKAPTQIRWPFIWPHLTLDCDRGHDRLSLLGLRPIVHQTNKGDAKFNKTMGLQGYIFDLNQSFGIIILQGASGNTVKFSFSKIDGVSLLFFFSRLHFFVCEFETIDTRYCVFFLFLCFLILLKPKYYSPVVTNADPAIKTKIYSRPAVIIKSSLVLQNTQVNKQQFI